MKRLDASKPFYAFSSELAPTLTVAAGESFVLETMDCYGGQLKSPEDTLDRMNWATTNPATGPVYVEGIKAGDVIRVQIEDLKLTGNSVMFTRPGSGKVKGIVTPETSILEVVDDRLRVPTACGELSLPVKPMIGVIGVAPVEGACSNAVPDAHGGNMDCKLIGAGTTNVILGHLSGENNTPLLARRVSTQAMEREGIRPGEDVRLQVAMRDEVGKVYILKERA